MAMFEFVQRVKTARNVAYRYLQPGGGSEPRAGADWERLRAAAPLWLAPGVVADLDAAEFGFLPADRRAALAAAVAEFRRIAAGAAACPPTDDEMTAGLAELARTVESLDEVIADPEGLGLLAVLLRDSGPLPPFVLGFNYRLDTDWSGDPAVWFEIILADDLDPDAPEFRDFATKFRGIGWDIVKAVGSNRIPYRNYRPMSDVLHPFVDEDAA